MEWREFHDTATIPILAALCANPTYATWSHKSLASEAVWCADALVDELKKREQKEISSPLIPTGSHTTPT